VNDVPWPAGAATGIGSLPGTDIAEALRIVFGELPDLPHLPELPARGPGADLIGRTAAMLVELPIELYAAQWRLAARPGIDLRRANDLRERDLDTLTEQADGYAGPLKLQAAGPWTLAAGLDLPVGGRILRDAGAVRDLTDSLAEGLAGHVNEVVARVPGASVILQLDEPSLPAVIVGGIPTESGLHRYRAVEESVAEQTLHRVIDQVGAPVVVHCCAADVPVGLLRSAGAVAVSLDFDLLDLDDAAALDPLGEALDTGFGLFAGVVPTSPPAPEASDAADRVRTLWRRFGFKPEKLPEQVVVTPACGLAGATPDYARAVMTTCREIARRLADDPG
jgi:methionine synthase II (cobalamin-independent)